MPIRPENRWPYPIDWKEPSAEIRFEQRAKGRCEGCGRPHGQLVYHLGDGRWWDLDAKAWRNGRGRVLKSPPASMPAAITPLQATHVVLACAHLDHDRATTTQKTCAHFASAVPSFTIAPSTTANVGHLSAA